MPRTISTTAVFSLACALALVAACDLEAPHAFGDIEAIDVARQSFVGDYDDYGCQSGHCGTNSRKILGNGIGELDLKGHPNAGGWVYDGFIDGSGTSMKLQVRDDELVASRLAVVAFPSRGRVGGYTTKSRRRTAELKGRALLGGMLLFHHETTPRKQHGLRIDGYSEAIKFWIPPHRPMHAYRFTAVEWAHWIGSYTEPLCGDAGPPDARWRSLDNYAFAFAGDRYNGHDLTVTTVDDDTGTVIASSSNSPREWFNLGCVGYAGAKLLALRQAAASSTPSYRTTVDERQALLKMFTGDVCGDGRALTETGTPLYFRVLSGGWAYGFNCAIQSHEAIWDEDGAVCVDQFRLPGEVYEEAATDCGITTCSNHQLANWKNYGKVLSSLPLSGICTGYSPPPTPPVRTPGTVVAFPTQP